MTKTILVTGGYGFLGRSVARRFKDLGCEVYGIGNGRWDSNEARAHGFDAWLDATITMSGLLTLDRSFDVIVHCGGNGSVGYSITNPLQDFKKTVEGTAELLEYIRLNNPEARVVYPSSVGVHGARPDAPIKESDPLTPISPYGCHKKMAEELCISYSQSYGVKVSIIRFFSIYGPGLTKQLLWDAAHKLLSTENKVVFWGTGEETRDWIYVDDAAELILRESYQGELFRVINGGSGYRVNVRTVIEMLRNSLGAAASFEFNNIVKEGDPRFYHADISAAREMGWATSVPLGEGIQRYAEWFKRYRND